MCNLYSITTNQAAIIAIRVVNRYVGNLNAGPELLHAALLIEPVLQLGHLLAQRRKSVCE